MNDDDSVLLSDLCCWKLSHIAKRNGLSRAAGLYFFVLEGICIGLWGMILPTIQRNLRLTDSKLGAAALCTYFGTLVATPLAAYLIYQLGVRRTALLGTLGFCVSLPLIVAFDSYLALLFFMLIFGLFWGITDVVANNTTVLAEIVGGESYMGTCYGIFSVTAGMISLVEQEINSNLIESVICLSMVMILLNVVFVWMVYDQMQELHILEFNRQQEQTRLSNVSHVLDVTDSTGTRNPIRKEQSRNMQESEIEMGSITDDNESSGPEPPSGSPSKSHYLKRQSAYAALSLEEDGSNKQISTSNDSTESSLAACMRSVLSCPRALLILGSVGFLGTFCEACFITWIVIYYDQVLHVTPSTRAAGFGCIFVSMAISRLSCDFLRSKFTTRQIVLAMGMLLTTGLWLIFAVSFISNSVVLTSLGMVLVGLGVAPLNPIAFSSAGHLPGLQSSGSAVATVAACAYSGSIISSPLVGIIAEATGSLRYGFLFVTVVVTGIVPLSFYVPT